jgi:hypothetical protein
MARDIPAKTAQGFRQNATNRDREIRGLAIIVLEIKIERIR